jgi:hypothetical protein
VTAVGFKAHTRISLSLSYDQPPTTYAEPPATLLRTFSIQAKGTTKLGKLYDLGIYEVATSAPNGRRVSVSFAVIPSDPSP